MSILTAKEVTYEYRNSHQIVRAVDGVSCEFEQGLVYAIVGSSGSGKTTFLSLLAGLDVPTSGTIALDRQSTAELDRDEYRLNHVSVIYQNICKEVTCMTNYREILRLHSPGFNKTEITFRCKCARNTAARNGRCRRICRANSSQSVCSRPKP